MPGTSANFSETITWQVEVPMIATICPGLTAFAAAEVTCASTLPTATAIPSGRPVHFEASAVKVPAQAPRAPSSCSNFSAIKFSNFGLSAARYSFVGYFPSW